MVNELFTNANNGKQNWVDVVGSPLVNTDTFSTLKSKTQTIKDGLATNLVAKGVSATGTETLTALKDKVANINTKMYSQVSRTGYEALILNCIIDGYGYFVDTSSKVAIKINLKNNTVEKAIDCSTLTGNICSYTDYGILIGTGTWYRVYNEAKTLLSENLSRGAYTTQDTSFHSSLFITGNKLYSVASNGTDNSIEYYSNGTYIGKLYRAINGSTNFGNICGLLYVKNNSVEKMIITTQYTNTINYYKLINDISITSTKTDGSDLTKISSNAIYNSLSYCLMNDLI
jgi:hypothetical protein